MFCRPVQCGFLKLKLIKNENKNATLTLNLRRMLGITKQTPDEAENGNKSKPLFTLVFLDKNGIELQNGSIINIHQTVNGENLFVMLDVEKLDLRYGFNLAYKYEYDVTELLVPNTLNGDIEWEIVGSLNMTIENYR